MNREIELEITNAARYIQEIKELLNDFLAHLDGHADPEVVPGRIVVQDQTISIECYGGLSLRADPKVVKDGRGDFAIEYVFCAREGESEEELWRFYLTEDRRLRVSIDGDDSLCDFDNRYVAGYICVPVMHAALSSLIFKPTEKG